MAKIVATSRQLRALERVAKPCFRKQDSDALRIVAFSDYRVQDILLLLQFIRDLKPGPDLLIYAGDDVERFHTDSQNLLEQLAAASMHGLCAVIGNDPVDEQDKYRARISLRHEVNAGRSYIRGNGVYNVHENPLVIGDYAVIGNEGAPPDDKWGALGTVIYPEASMARHLALAATAVREKHLIVVSHTPPRGTLDLAIRFGTRHIGSLALRTFIQKRENVRLAVCGHVHYCGGQSKKLGKCLVVNAASHDDYGAPGRVAVIDMRAGKVASLQWHLLWELASVPGIGDGRRSRLEDSGITPISALINASRDDIVRALRCGVSEAESLLARATALSTGECIIRGELSLPRDNRAYLDIETDLNGKFIWLIGIHIESSNATRSLYAETPADERYVLEELLRLCESHPELNLLCYSNSRFEQRLLSQRLSAYGLPIDVTRSIRDIYFDIAACAAFPTQQLGLKDIASWCGFKWRNGNMTGFDAAVLYGSGKLTPPRKRLLIQYNEDDVLAMKHVVSHLEEFAQRRSRAANAD